MTGRLPELTGTRSIDGKASVAVDGIIACCFNFES